MRRPFLLSMVLLLVAGSVFAHGQHGSHLNISFDSRGDIADCSDLSVRFAGERVPVVVEEVPFHGSALRIRADQSRGGVRVVGWSGNSYSVSVCKAAAPGLDPAAVRAVLAGNEVSVTGPEGEQWVAYFLIRTPRGADLDLTASNGPVAIANFNGTVNARTSNGPLSVKDSSGSITATATNGPVSISGGSGDVKLQATNGPVSVRLSDTIWNGTLEASTQNGPVSIRVPRGFRSGLVVEQLGGGPLSCKAEACAGQRIERFDRQRPRRIELGSGPAVVRISTVNGPASIRETE